MSHDPMISALLSDRFRILRNLQKGGVNTLYEAEDIVLRRRVAVKFVYRAYLSTRRAEARFQQELSLVRSLKSPHIAQIFDVGVTEDGAPFVVSEALPGEDLRERLSREGRLSAAKAVEIAVQALNGLSEAHSHGLLHLNIKPENLFLAVGERGDELCKLQDFGISKIRVSRFWRHMDAEMRSLVYAAPEHLREDGKVDHRADQYSVAAVLYECLTGKPPRELTEERSVAELIRAEPPLDVETLRPGLPRGLGLVIDRALANDPSERYPSARAFAEALSPFARGKLRSLAPVAAAAAKTVRPSLRVPALVLGALVLGFAGYRALVGDPTVELSEEPPPPSATPATAPSLAPPAPSAAPAPSEKPPDPVALSPSAAPLPSVSAAELLPTLCYLNGDSGNISVKRPWCKNVKFIKPNMKQKEKFPKWIPKHCEELSVYHCNAAQ